MNATNTSNTPTACASDNHTRMTNRARNYSAESTSSTQTKKIHYKINEDTHGNQDNGSASVSPLTVLKNVAVLCLTILITAGATTIMFILYIAVRPFSVPTYRRLSCTLAVASFFDAMALLLPNTKLFLSGDSDPISPVGVSVLVCNHSMDADWWAMLMLARCVGLRGSVKAFLQHKSPLGGSPNHSTHDLRSNGNGNGNSNINGTMPMSASAPILRNSLSGQGFSNTTRNHSQQAINFANGSVSSSLPSPSNGNAKRIFLPNAQGEKQNQGLAITFLNKFLDFPLLSSENTQTYVQDRFELFSLLRDFASSSANVPTHLLLFPEGWPEGQDRKSMIKKSIEFAKREGRPQLKHLLLPRTTGFYASLDSLREASPVVYDVTIAYRGYNGQTPFTRNSWFDTLLQLIRGETPNEIHLRIKRFSMGEVLSNTNWLDKQWMEKDRLLDNFERHGVFPVDNRGFCRHMVMDTKYHSVESSLSALVRLGLIPFSIPILLFLAIPLLFSLGWIWIAHRSFMLLFPGGFGDLFGSGDGISGQDRKHEGNGGQASVSSDGGGSDSAVGTPYFPATPFASPTSARWRSANCNEEASSNQNRR